LDPIALTGLTAAGTALVLAGCGHGYLLRPPTPSPATVRRAAQVTAAGGLAASVALAGAGTAAADDTPWSVNSPTAASAAPEATSTPTAPPGPDNPQARPDGSVSIETVPPATWGVTTPTVTPAPEGSTAAASSRPSAPASAGRKPKAPRRTTRTGRVVVRPGDTLSGIARAHGTSVAALVEANAAARPSLTRDPDMIRAGWRLRLPGGAR